MPNCINILFDIFFRCLGALFCIGLMACAAPMKVEDVSFQHPSSVQGHQVIDGLSIAVVPLDSEQRSKEIFSTDIKTADILPIHVIVHNGGDKEFEINHQQIFGITTDNQYQVAFTLNNAAQKVRESSIGTTAVSQTVAGAVVGAAVGAGVGAGIGHAAGNTGRGASSGAIIGGSTGAAAGLSKGVSDSWTLEFKQQLATHAFEDRVIYPSDIQQGFVYLRWRPYAKIRIKLFNITDNKTQEIIFPISVKR